MEEPLNNNVDLGVKIKRLVEAFLALAQRL